jgi:hypothetical protein
MKNILFVLLLMLGVGVMRPPLQKVERLPLQKKNIELKSPTNYAHRVIRYDPQTNQPITYDPKPRVTILDAKSGRYALKWIGYDGKGKTVIYQRPDAIDAVVSASVSKTNSGKFAYVYKVQNLPTSGQHLSTFAVQSFAADVEPEKIGEYVGKMSSNGVLKDGNWISFGIATYQPQVIPGREIQMRLVSSAPPGLVECRIHGGQLGMKGVGEDMPMELENVLPGYEIWPHGYTIGPIDDLKAFTPNRRAKYIRKRLSEFQQLGWIAADSVSWYEQNLTGENLDNLHQRAEQDFKASKITIEVYAMIQSIRQ